MGITVQYIGKREIYVDKLYRSGLTFVPEQTRHVSGELARKLLRHIDLFRATDVEDTPLEPAFEEDPLLDTFSEDLIAGIKDQIITMDKNALELFAREKYGHELDKRFGIEKLRVQVMEMIDQYGIV
jgi:hypothetical protein